MNKRTDRHHKLYPSIVFSIVVPCAVLFSSGASAFNDSWSVSPLLGVHQPSLEHLNKKEFIADMPSSGSVIIDAESSTDVEFILRNTLPEIRFGTYSGVELANRIKPDSELLFGLGVWEGGSTSVVATTVPFQGVLSDAVFERKANVSYMEYFIGWRKHFPYQKHGLKFHGAVKLHELFDIDYRESMVFAFKSGPADTFKRIVIMETQATGVLMLSADFGVEKYFTRWFSLSFDAGYTAGVSPFFLNNATLKSDYQVNDNLDVVLPAKLDEEGKLSYLGSDNVTFYPIRLKFDGWQSMLRISFHY